MAKNTETSSQDGVLKDENIKANYSYHTRSNPPISQKMIFTKGPKTQIAEFDNSPQEVLVRHGLYQDESIYKHNPQAIYADISEFPDLQEHLNSMIELQGKFMNMPADVRQRFNNDIIRFADYIKNGDINNENFIKKLMTDDDYNALQKHKKHQQAKKEYEEYLASDEYKAKLAEEQSYREYQYENYQNWKKNKKS